MVQFTKKTNITYIKIIRSSINVIALWLGISFFAQSAQIVLQDIKINKKGVDTEVEFEFGLPLHYVKHFPQSAGEILQIQLSLEPEHDRIIHKEVRQGNALKPADGTDSSILTYVTYEEGVPGGPYLTLRFSKRVKFNVTAGNSLRTLSIIIVGDKQDEVKTAGPKKLITIGKSRLLDIPVPDTTKARKRPKKDVGELLAKARQTLTFGDNAGAIDLLRRIIRMPESQYTQDARELLGLALERSNQIPRAKFEYKKYLKLYKKGTGAERVKQRLAALRDIGSERRSKLRRTRRGKKDGDFRLFGRLSQAYDARFLQREKEEDEEKAVNIEDLVLSRRMSTHFSVRSRYSSSERSMQAVFTGSQIYDMQDAENTETRLSEFYVDYNEIKDGLSTKLGRQRSRNSGVFGRYDGVALSYAVSPVISSSVLFGRPLEFGDPAYQKQFAGLKLDFGKRKDRFAGNAYYVQQKVNNLTDRVAVGAGMRYADPTTSLFVLADYDLYFGELNLVNVRWGWKYSENSKVNVSFNQQQILQVSSALNSLRYEEVDTTVVPQKSISTNFNDKIDLLPQIFSEDRIKQLAKNRTAKNYNMTIGNTYQINKDQQINIDVSTFRSGGTEITTFTPAEESAAFQLVGETSAVTVDGLPDIPKVDKTSWQSSLSGQFIASNYFAERDLYVLGFRYSNNDNFQDINMYFNGRFPPIRNWNMRPRLALTHRKISIDSSTQGIGASNAQPHGVRISIAPSIKVDYRWKKEWVFDIEVGLDVSKVSQDEGTLKGDTKENIRVGYSYSF